MQSGMILEAINDTGTTLDNAFQGFDRLEQAKMTEKLVISRYWNNPIITIQVDRDKIAIYENLEDFIKAVLLEVKAPILLTRRSLRKRIIEAANTAVEKTKEATAQVM